MTRKIFYILTLLVILFGFTGISIGNNEKLISALGENGKWGFVNRSGHFVIKPLYNYAFEFKEGLALVYVCKKFGYINTDGKLLHNRVVFDKAQNFYEGLAAVAIQAGTIFRWGYIDLKGDFVISPKYEKAGNFKNGKAEVIFKGKIFLIDKKGNTVSES